ncbi:serine/threonine-protein kinase [Candidatus Uabimicrobium amorphum]|uniref:Protein kinase domain-containing protein n=1 Tax=Uabimicrobium amorphum TaxID=2596890 RepID=A0A5S9INJ9_UABAM|nr:serine/threonine-protein kinase [Candidatus Uabimicrobium amorphum]BBM84611.1 hypothetical protein UABAM_02972 [Candidatus Uabimicrobium amorphum]
MLLNQRYQIQRIIGQGGMGKVYYAIDVHHKKPVAIKECIVKKDKNILERVQREYYFMLKCHHPGVVKASDFCLYNNHYFIVMEYVDGISLSNFIKQKSKCIDLQKQLEISLQLCEAVAFLHKNGIIHRDLKPSNIILYSENLKPKLLDLGIAKCIDQELATITNANSLIGTPGYMAPEQFIPKEKITTNTDVFSLGVILYQLFTWTERSPLYGGHIASTMTKTLELQIPSLISLSPFQDLRLQKLSDLLESCLCKKSSRRVPLEQLCVNLRKLLSPTKGNVTNTTRIQYPLNLDNTATKQVKIQPNITKASNKKPSKIAQRLPILLTFLSICFGLVYLLSTTNKPKKEHRPNINNVEQSATNRPKKLISKNIIRRQKKHNLDVKHVDKNVIDKATSLASQNAIDHYQKGKIYDRQKKHHLAVVSYTKAIELSFQYFDAYYARGVAYYELKKYRLATADATKVIQIKPQYFEPYILRGAAWYHLHNDNLAVADANIAIKLNSQSSDAYYLRAMAYYSLRKYRRAVADSSKALEINPQHLYANYRRGMAYYELKKYGHAIADGSKAIERTPHDHNVYLLRGAAYYWSGKHALAISDTSQAININPQSSESYHIRGMAYYNLQKYVLAVADSSKALEITPQHIYASYRRAMAYYRLGKYHLAITDNTKAIELTPNDHSPYYLQGLIYQALEKYDLAIIHYTKTIKLNSQYSKAYRSRASVYQQLGQHELAEADIKEYNKQTHLHLQNTKAK